MAGYFLESELDEDGLKLLSSVEDWCGDLLLIEKELYIVDESNPNLRNMDDFLGVVNLREGIECRVVGKPFRPHCLLVADHFFKSITVECGIDWSISGESAGPGWWWSRLPKEGRIATDAKRWGMVAKFPREG